VLAILCLLGVTQGEAKETESTDIMKIGLEM